MKKKEQEKAERKRKWLEMRAARRSQNSQGMNPHMAMQTAP